MSAPTLLRLALLLAMLAGAAAAAALLPDAAPRIAIVLCALTTPIAIHAVILAIEFTTGAIVDPRLPRGSSWHVIRVWAWETRASVVTMHWRIPLHTRALPPPRRGPGRPAVLLIHGYLCNHAVWQPMLDGGILDDCSVAAVDLEPVFADLDRYANIVRAGIESLLSATGAPRAILLCHSMGGLAARAYLRRHGDARILRVITINTPHYGTIFGRLGHGANSKQMAFRSVYLRELAASESPALRARFVCIASRDDNLIVPRSSMLLDGAASRHVDGIGHLQTLDTVPVWRIVGEEIRSASAGS